jgi:hypothetical protein
MRPVINAGIFTENYIERTGLLLFSPMAVYAGSGMENCIVMEIFHP